MWLCQSSYDKASTDSYLFASEIDINTIRSWLDHVSVNITNIYAEVSLRMKAKALKM